MKDQSKDDNSERTGMEPDFTHCQIESEGREVVGEDSRHMTEISISMIKVGTRYRKDLGDLKDLIESIQRVGLLHPIVLKPDHSLIAGQRRLEACRSLGWELIPARIVDLKDPIIAEHDENIVRKPFLPSEAVAIKRAIEPELKEQAKQRQREAGKLGGAISGKGRQKQQGGENFSLPYSPKTRDAVSAVTGVSHPSMHKAEAIVKAAEDDPEKFDHLVQEMDRRGRVDPVYRKLVELQKFEQREPHIPDVKETTVTSRIAPDSVSSEAKSSLPFEFALSQKMPPFWVGFDVILVNIPWEHLGKPGYPYVSNLAAGQVPVAVAASDDCIVWLRATNYHMDDAFRCLSDWGFKARTILTWVKTDALEGEWLNERTEHYIVATYGNPPIRRDQLPTTALVAPSKKGSLKPEGFYHLIEQMCQGQLRLEIFCEGPQEGWKSWTPSGIVKWFHEHHNYDGSPKENPEANEKPRKKKRK